MKSSVLIKTLNFVLVFALLASSCQKPEAADSGMESSIFKFPFNDRSGDPLSEQAFNEVVNNAYETEGKQLYDLLRHRIGVINPVDLLADDLKAPMLAALEEERGNNIGQTAYQVLQEARLEGIINDNELNLFIEFNNLMAAQENVDLSFGQAWYLIRNWELQTLNNNGIPAEDKDLVLLNTSALRNIIKYSYESGEIADDRGDDCFLGRKLSCWESVLSKTLLEAVKATATVAFNYLLGGGNVGWKEIKSIFKASGVGMTVAVVEMYLKKSCKCDSSEPQTETCERPKGISFLTADCNPLEQMATVWGGNAVGSLWVWVVENGTFPTNGGLSTATTINPGILVKQTDPQIPINLAVYPQCQATPSPFVGTFSIPTIVNSVGTVLPFPAWDNAYVGSTKKYYFNGTWKFNDNALLTYTGCSPHGTVLNQGDDFAEVKWNSLNPTTFPASVTGIVTNYCSNASLQANVQPIYLQ